MKPIMIDSYEKCENYRDSRKHTVAGWHEIVEGGEGVWRKKSCTVGGNKCHSVGRVGKGLSGWIGKGGFNPHT